MGAVFVSSLTTPPLEEQAQNLSLSSHLSAVNNTKLRFTSFPSGRFTIVQRERVAVWRPYLAGFVLSKRSRNLSGTTRLEESADCISIPEALNSTVQAFGPLVTMILAQALQL